MQTLKIDENNNLVLTQNSLTLVSDVEACAQDVKTRIGLYVGENPLDADDGTDFDNTILGKGGGEAYAKSQIQARILKSDEIMSVPSVSFEEKGGQVLMTTKINSIYGVFEL